MGLSEDEVSAEVCLTFVIGVTESGSIRFPPHRVLDDVLELVQGGSQLCCGVQRIRDVDVPLAVGGEGRAGIGIPWITSIGMPIVVASEVRSEAAPPGS